MHRPVRRRRGSDEHGTNEPASLELVETQAPTTPLAMEDSLPRRTKPRKRRGGSSDSEPLMLVETQNDAQHGDAPPVQ